MSPLLKWKDDIIILFPPQMGETTSCFFILFTSGRSYFFLKQPAGVLIIYRLKLALTVSVMCAALLFAFQQPVAAGCRIVINKGTNQLAFFKDRFLLDVFPVASGRLPEYTPEGNWEVVVKLVYPSWRHPEGGPLIPGGVPENPLGPRWLGLNARGTGGSSYGVHGNNNPYSIGTHASSGCIRMYNDDILWLYDRVPLGTEVAIINSNENLDEWKSIASVTINGSELEFEPHLGPVQAGETTYIPVRPAATALGYRLFWNEVNHNLSLANVDREVSITPDSNRVSLNNVVLTTEETPFLLEDRIFVTVPFFEQFLGTAIYLEEEDRTLALKLPVDPTNRLSKYHLSLQIDGKSLDLPEALTPLREGQDLLVPARKVCSAAGAGVSWNEAAKSVEIIKRGRRASIPVSGSPALIDGAVSDTRANIHVVNGTSYINLSFLTDVFGFLADVDDNSRVLNISTNFTSVLSNPYPKKFI